MNLEWCPEEIDGKPIKSPLTSKSGVESIFLLMKHLQSQLLEIFIFSVMFASVAFFSAFAGALSPVSFCEFILGHLFNKVKVVKVWIH